MNMIKRCTAAILLAVMLLAMFPTAAFATQGYEENNCLKFVTEPGETSSHVAFYKDGAQQPLEEMTWVDGGRHGKALSLNGQSEYLEIGYYQLRMAQMTFATWINFKGTVDEANPAGNYWQRLFTISASEQCYFTVSPHALDQNVTNTEGQLDGVYMEYYRGYSAENGQEYSMKSFTGATAGMSHFGLPQNEWHHMAVVVDSASVKLYIDGNLILEDVFLMPIVQMSANSLKVGGGIWNDPTLHALLDETVIYDKALSAQQIAALMQTGDVASIHTPEQFTTTATEYIPTTVATTQPQTEVTEQPADKPFAPFGLPVWGFAVVAGLLGLIIVLTVIVNLYESNWRKEHVEKLPSNADVAADVEDPELSIKQAALKKRREEHERFLAEEAEERNKQEEQIRVTDDGQGSTSDEDSTSDEEQE